ncbi:MAG: hypothetical protein ACXWZZ_01115 [Solirubrobacteraceae bacterium]
MHNRQLHGALAAFVEEAAWQLSAETADGAEIPFEVVRGGRRDSPLYCYRPLTADFIEQRVGLLSRLPSFLPAVHALSGLGRLGDYLESRGERGYPAEPRARAEFALRVFLTRVFEESTDFALSPERLERAYREVESALYDGRTETVVIAPLLGLEIASSELALGEGLTLVQGDAFPEDAPADALWAPGAQRPHLLVVVRWEAAAGDTTPVAHARVRLRRLLTALRLYDGASVGFGPLAWTRTGGSPWQPFALGALGRRGEEPIALAAHQEDELRAFCSLIVRRTPRSGELSWALRRYEMSCERVIAGEALTDVLLALRALIEPEGPASGRLAGRLGALCALPADRAALTARVAHTIVAERALIAGLEVDPELDALAAELAGHLRALLRDVLCGHLDSDLRSVAEDLIGQDAGTEQPTLA